jgi:hypothetical protein
VTVTPADLPAEFAGVDPDIAQEWIDIAEGVVDRGAWACAGVLADKGVRMLASHYLKHIGEGTNAQISVGVLTAQAVGRVSVSKATPGAATGPNGSTTYGQAFDALQKTVNASPRRHLPPPPSPRCA